MFILMFETLFSDLYILFVKSFNKLCLKEQLLDYLQRRQLVFLFNLHTNFNMYHRLHFRMVQTKLELMIISLGYYCSAYLFIYVIVVRSIWLQTISKVYWNSFKQFPLLPNHHLIYFVLLHFLFYSFMLFERCQVLHEDKFTSILSANLVLELSVP